MVENVLALHSLTVDENARALSFFDAVSRKVLGQENLRDTVQVIVVAHAYENVLPFIQSVNKVFTVAGVILKNSTGTVRPEYADCLRGAGIRVLDIKKANFATKGSHAENAAFAELRTCLAPDKKTIIMDHGGYFAFQDGAILFREEFARDKLIAITEYAANGEERWKRLPVDRPVISIGYAHIKESSDFAAAEAIVDGAISFSQSHNVPLMAKTTRIGVIGLGRLGGSIVDKFSRNLVHPLVYDRDELKMSGLRHAHVVSRERLLRESDVIFCATGNGAILPGDYRTMKNGAVIFTVTSPDDEINLPALIDKGILIASGIKGQAHVYKVAGTDKSIYLPFNGESANIIFSSSVNDPTILQPCALHTVVTIEAALHAGDYKPGVHRVERGYEDLVAHVWNACYNPDYNEPLIT